ncbi:MAG: nucleotide exchange factor GrpE [Planctomycetaceae bacterium]|nr:nucleotide exchange factor GrpE [Planctomycetaceae bacterium]
MTDKNERPEQDEQPATDEPAPRAPLEPVAGEVAQALRAERDDLLSRLQRVSADYVNYQKRAAREAADAREFANADLIKNLLPVLDDMERALETARASHGEDDPLFHGLQLVHDKAMEALAKFGVRRIEAAGKEFDPQLHQALLQEVRDDVPPQTVLTELQRGYTLSGRVIRPAGVITSKIP